MDPNKLRVSWLCQNKQIRLAQGFFPLHHNDFALSRFRLSEI